MSRMFNAQEHKGEGTVELQPGTYEVFIIDDNETGGVNRREGKKGDYLSLTLMIVGPERHKGMRIWTNLSLSQAAWFKLAQLYNAVEPKESNQRVFDLDSDEDIHEELFYKVFRVECSQKEYNGKKSLNPEKFIAIDDDDEYTRAFELASELVEQGKAGGGPRGVEGDEDSNYEVDDDTPF